MKTDKDGQGRTRTDKDGRRSGETGRRSGEYKRRKKMSGGSYNYLFTKEPAELLQDYNIGYIEEMADRLMQSGYKDVAKDMQRLAQYCKSANLRISVLSEELSDVMHAIEWCVSGDWGEDRIKNAVEKYRNRGESFWARGAGSESGGGCEACGGCEGCGNGEAGGDQRAKEDSGKLRLELVPREIIRNIAAVREYGTRKYKDPENWRRVEEERFRNAAFRHFLAFLDEPEGADEESGLPHLWHLACNIAFLCEKEKERGTWTGKNF